MYIPKTSYFSPTRVQKLAKEVISDCRQDRDRALKAFDYFKDMVAANPEDAKAQTEMKQAPPKKEEESVTFASLRNNGKN